MAAGHRRIMDALEELESSLQECIKGHVDAKDFMTAQRYMHVASMVASSLRPALDSDDPIAAITSQSVGSATSSLEGLELPTYGFVDERFYRVGESQSRPDGYYRLSAEAKDIKIVLEELVEQYRGDNRFSRDDLKAKTPEDIKGYVIDLVITAAVELGAVKTKGHGTYAVSDPRLCSLDEFTESFGELPPSLR